jgi:aryl-alcohol dehydrogenase-like predicted oxidoreductase/predicted dehydrogenase
MVKWGVIGTGSISTAFCDSIKYSKQGKLSAVASRSSKNLKKFTDKYQVNTFDSYDALLDDPSIDAVYIGTPHNSHYELSLKTLRSGKHLLCEKPMTMNSTEAMILLNEARVNNLFFMEAFMYRCHPLTHKMLEIVKQEFSDQEVLIESSFGFTADVTEDHRLKNPTLGGGSILDIGCYPLSMARLIAGNLMGKSFSDPISISASGNLSSENIDLNAKAEIRFNSKIKAIIKSAINEEYENSLRIKLNNKEVFIKEPWHCGQFQGQKAEIKVIENDDEQVFKINDEVGLFTREIDEASQCILDNQIESPFMSHADSLSNSIWLDKWLNELQVIYPANKTETSSLSKSPFLKNSEDLKSIKFPELSKDISPIVFGCDNQINEVHAFAMFDYYYSKGGKVFDTAFIYNNGLSDRYLGNWINSRSLSDVVVLGKGAHTPDCFPEKIKAQIEESLSRGGIDKLDIYCLHRDNLDVPVTEFIDALNECKNLGLIDVLGASNWELERFKAANDYADNRGITGFKVLSNNFSLARMIEPVWPGCISCDEEYLSYLNEKNIHLFPWSSQARGFFVNKVEFAANEHFANPTDEEEKRVWHDDLNLARRNRAIKLAKDKNCEPIQIALSYVVNHKVSTYPLVGPRNFFELDSCIKAANIHLTAKDLRYLEEGS